MAIKKDPKEKQSEKIVIYCTPREKRIAMRKAKAADYPSTSSWGYAKLASHLNEPSHA